MHAYHAHVGALSVLHTTVVPYPLSFALIMLIARAVMVPKTAQTIASVVMLTFVLTAGFFVTTIPVWISWLKCESLGCFDSLDVCIDGVGWNGRASACCLIKSDATILNVSCADLSFIFYGFGLLLHIEYKGRSIYE